MRFIIYNLSYTSLFHCGKIWFWETRILAYFPQCLVRNFSAEWYKALLIISKTMHYNNLTLRIYGLVQLSNWIVEMKVMTGSLYFQRSILEWPYKCCNFCTNCSFKHSNGPITVTFHAVKTTLLFRVHHVNTFRHFIVGKRWRYSDIWTGVFISTWRRVYIYPWTLT